MCRNEVYELNLDNSTDRDTLKKLTEKKTPYMKRLWLNRFGFTGDKDVQDFLEQAFPFKLQLFKFDWTKDANVIQVNKFIDSLEKSLPRVSREIYFRY
jgi:hypothetical protein